MKTIFNRPVVVGLISFLLLSIAVVGAQAQSKSLTLTSLDGQPVTLDSMRGKVVVLAFGGSHIPLDRTLLPQLQRLASRYPNDKVSVIWAPTNSSRAGARGYASDDDLRAFAARYGFKGPVLRDQDGAFRQFGGQQLPIIVIFDKQGNLHGSPHAGMDPDEDIVNELSSVIDRLL